MESSQQAATAGVLTNHFVAEQLVVMGPIGGVRTNIAGRIWTEKRIVESHGMLKTIDYLAATNLQESLFTNH